MLDEITEPRVQSLIEQLLGLSAGQFVTFVFLIGGYGLWMIRLYRYMGRIDANMRHITDWISILHRDNQSLHQEDRRLSDRQTKIVERVVFVETVIDQVLKSRMRKRRVIPAIDATEVIPEPKLEPTSNEGDFY